MTVSGGGGRGEPTLVEHVLGLGGTRAQVEGLDDDELIALAGDLALTRGLDLDLAGLSARCGVDEDRIRALYASIGLPADTLPGFGSGDVELVSLATVDPTGIVDQVANELLRVAGTSLRRLAEAAVAAYVQDIEGANIERGEDPRVLADTNHASSALIVAFAATLGTMYRHHMWLAVQQQRSGQDGVATRELTRAAVGFVDLVGYTRMSRTLEPAALRELLDGFERRAFEVATTHRGRVVKSIGDEVMVTAPTIEAVARIVLDLVAAFGGEPHTRPRGGISAGEVLFRLGDLYGPVVNVAARLAAVASPGEVLTDVGVVDPAALSLQAAGPRELKGFDGPIEVYSVGLAAP